MLEILKGLGDFIVQICQIIYDFFNDLIELIVLFGKAAVMIGAFIQHLPLIYQAAFSVLIAYYTIYFVVKIGG